MISDSNLTSIAAVYGTPLFVYDLSKIEAAITTLQGLLDWKIFYATKANSNLTLLKEISKTGIGFDVVSEGELRRVFEATGTLSQTVFSGVGKSREEISFALTHSIKSIHVESISELRMIETVASGMNMQAPISLRVNPDIEGGSHPHLTTGVKSSKFGIPIEGLGEITSFLKQASHVKLLGISCHIGSNITSLEAYENAYRSLVQVFKSLTHQGFALSLIDFGGGMGVSYSGHYTPLDITSYSKIISRLTHDIDAEVLIEPGKFIIAESGILLTSITHIKENGSYKFYITDAGMNDLIRPSLYDAFHKIDVIGRKSSETEVVDVVGPVCETGCFFAKKRELPKAKQGDLLAIRDVGGYGFSMSSNYNSRLRAAEVLVYPDGEVRLIRKRETWEALWKDELL